MRRQKIDIKNLKQISNSPFETNTKFINDILNYIQIYIDEAFFYNIEAIYGSNIFESKNKLLNLSKDEKESLCEIYQTIKNFGIEYLSKVLDSYQTKNKNMNFSETFSEVIQVLEDVPESNIRYARKPNFFKFQVNQDF